MARTSGTTRADEIFARIRLDILGGDLSPGSKLAFAELGARYQASTGVLREVLPRLVEQGLATSESQLGFRVMTVSVGKLRSLTEARVAIESLVARRAVEVGDLSWEANLVAAHHSLARTHWHEEQYLQEWSTRDPADRGELLPVRADWITHHENFHKTLLRGCNNEHLYSIAVRLRAIAEVYRYWTAAEGERMHRDLAGEHRAILDAAVARDPELCAKLVGDHIQLTTDLAIAAYQSQEATTI
ncbi:GntR family transcriptional regulator [Nocardioides sp.]|uniref:GntR family transcriptional regulator n=1 Tax=Nocardioides sp. TaxID=35761 RepID=UPI0039E46F50